MYSLMQPSYNTKLSEGLIKDAYNKVFENLFMRTEVDSFNEVFGKTHASWYAEPEFAGQYLDTAVRLYKYLGTKEVYDRAKKLAEIIISGQRGDGYLGTYEKGLEFDYTFSVWNQTFVLKGLISYYEEFGDEKALNAAMKCLDYVAGSYMSENGPELLKSINQGIENSCILLQAVRLFKITKKELYHKFCKFIIQKWESTTLRMISDPVLYNLGSLKAIEMLICYQGLLAFAEVEGDEEILASADIYWQQIKNEQIGITGNGTLGEMWTYIRNRPLHLTNDMLPNENCVAVGWMNFSAELFKLLGKAKYIDAIERTLYNHLFGSKSLDGSDFSYYQGTVGKKIHETKPGQYKCCSYRGMNIFSQLPEYIYWAGENELTIGLYISSESEIKINSANVQIAQQSSYPAEGDILISVNPDRDVEFTLKLRIPEWCEAFEVWVNGEKTFLEKNSGFIEIAGNWEASGSTVKLSLDMPVKAIGADIDGVKNEAFVYGPLVLAIDTRYGTPLYDTEVSAKAAPKPVEKGKGLSGYAPLVMFETQGKIDGKDSKITLVDYASAGSLDNEKDSFRIWIPSYESQ